MKKLLLIPTAVFPYIVCLGGYFLISGTFMKELFNDNAYNLFFALMALWIFGLVCMAVYTYIVKKNRTDPFKLVKTILWLKLIHIPAYVAMFAMSILCLFNIFTIIFTVAALMFSMLSILLTCVLSYYTIIRITQDGMLPLYTCALVLPMQLILVLDVFGMAIVYKKLK